jgi:hypothetical protein
MVFYRATVPNYLRRRSLQAIDSNGNLLYIDQTGNQCNIGDVGATPL